MPRYRTRPVEPREIEARRYGVPYHQRTDQKWEALAEELADWCGGDWTPSFLPHLAGPLVGVPTPEGYMDCHPGDWIIRRSGGSFGVLSDIDFKRQYEPIPEED